MYVFVLLFYLGWCIKFCTVCGDPKSMLCLEYGSPIDETNAELVLSI